MLLGVRCALHDASELTYATDLIDEEVQKIRELDEHQDLFEAFRNVKRLADPFDFALGPRPFVACFCEKDDLLSQWRGYGSSDSVSLNVDLQTIAGVSKPRVVMRKVVYDEDRQRALARDAMTAWVRTARNLMAEGRDPAEQFRWSVVELAEWNARLSLVL